MLFSLLLYAVVLKQLCEDVTSIARQCGKNMTDHYGRALLSMYLSCRREGREDEGQLPGSRHEGGYDKPEYDFGVEHSENN